MIVPDFFVGAMIDCLIDKGTDRTNVIKCLEWLNDKINNLPIKQHIEIYNRLHEVMVFDDDGDLVAIQCPFSDVEKDLWFSIYIKSRSLTFKYPTQFA